MCSSIALGVILRDNQEHTPEGFQSAIDVNLNGTMRMCYAAKSLLQHSYGCVINTASMLSFLEVDLYLPTAPVREGSCNSPKV